MAVDFPPIELTLDYLIIRDGADHYVQLPQLTTAERNALTAVNGMIVYNSDTAQFERYEDGAWGATAGLDANSLLSPALLPPCMDKYSNHLGAVDNYTQTTTVGNGTAVTDAGFHVMDLKSGTGVTGYALFQTKSTWLAGTKPHVGNIRLRTIVSGAGGTRFSYIGFVQSLTTTGVTQRAAFYYSGAGNWYAETKNAAGDESTTVTVGVLDLLTIVLTSSSAKFYVNGSLVATHTTYIPTVGLRFGANAHSIHGTETTERWVGVDMMDLVRYV